MDDHITVNCVESLMASMVSITFWGAWCTKCLKRVTYTVHGPGLDPSGVNGSSWTVDRQLSFKFLSLVCLPPPPDLYVSRGNSTAESTKL